MAAPTFETLLYTVNDGVAVITLNQPDVLNVFSARMLLDLLAVFDITDADDDVRVVIITGSGKAFCAGADLAKHGERTFDYDFIGGEDRELRTHLDGRPRDGGGQVSLRIFDSLKPVIAAVNGFAAGAGATIQLAADIRMASTRAKYGFVFTRRGLVPESASAWFLPRLVGVQTALEWCFSGRLVEAQEALEAGLVRSVHEPDDLMPAAMAVARDIADNTAPVAVSLTRQLIWRMLGAAHPMDAHRIDSRAIRNRGASADVREGVNSFLERRPAVFPGKVSKDLPDVWEGWPRSDF